MGNNTRRLGMGLDALFGPSGEKPAPKSDIEIDSIRTNPFQPRTEFDPAEIEALAASIRESGVIQPVIVRRRDGGHELVAGERRMRAAQAAGLKHIPAVVKELDDAAMLKVALVENIQRQDLNPLEKAIAFKGLMDKFGYTQEQVAKELGMNRTTVSNFVRLLDLPEEIREAVSKGLITQGHARALLTCKSRGEQAKMLRKIVKDGLSVRDTEQLVYPNQGSRPAKAPKGLSPLMRELEERFTEVFGTKVMIRPTRKGGRIVIEYYSNDHLTGLMDRFGVAA